MKTVLWLVCMIPLLLKTCLTSDEKSESKLLAVVGGVRIYQEEVLADMPAGLSEKDSANFVKEYLNNRINDLLVYNKAAENISQTRELEKMVENYRRSLVIYEYQQRVLNEQFKSERKEEEIRQYFEENSSRFTTDNHLIKGIFVKVPSNAPKLTNLEKWMSQPDEEDIPGIESYCVQYASIFNYFMDQWMPLNEVVGSVPALWEKGTDLLQEKKTFSVTDENGFTYILFVSEQVAKGSVAPYEYIRPLVVNVMLNAKKAAFLKSLEDDLRKKAIDDGSLILYN